MMMIMNICRVGAESFHADRQTYMTKLKLAICNSANAAKFCKSSVAETVVLGVVTNVLSLGVLIYVASTSALPTNGRSNLVRKR